MRASRSPLAVAPNAARKVDRPMGGNGKREGGSGGCHSERMPARAEVEESRLCWGRETFPFCASRVISYLPDPLSVPTATPRTPLAGFIAKFDPAIAKLARAARSKLRKQLPTAIELVYDNYNALAIGFAPTEKTSHAVLSLALWARGVNLYFTYGATLPDPDDLLEGNGNQGR